MDSAFKLISLILVSLAFALQSQNSYSYQNLAIAAGEPDFFRNPVTNFNSARFSANDPIYDPASRTVTTTRPYNVTGLDGKTYQASITKTAAADIPKVGAALSKFAQRVGPLSMALATVDLICSLSSICNQSGNWMLTQSADDQVSQLMGGWVANYDSSPIACSSDKDMKACASAVWGNSFDLGSFTYTTYPDRIESSISLKSKTTGTTLGEGKLRKLISNFQPAPPAEPTASDWTTAENKLSSPAGADRLAAELEPLPIKAPSVFSPISVPLGTATTTNKDALGNATGTQQTTRRMEIEDAATEAEPYRVTVKETETVTNYDLNNSPTSSTETIKQSDTPAEPPPPEDIEIDFDESVDRDLQTFEVPGLFSYTPFGGAGSCPADVTENTKFGNVTMSYAPVCRVAEGVKPFVILLAIIQLLHRIRISPIMKTILVPLAQFLDTYLGSFARNVLSSLGIGVISYAGIKTVFDELVALAQAQFSNIATDALAVVQLAGVGEAIGIIVGAITFKLTMTTMSSLGILPS